MHSIAYVAAVASLASGAFAQTGGLWSFNAISAPAKNEDVPAGKPYTIKWSPDGIKQTYTIMLMNGCPGNCMDIGPIGSALENTGSFVWTPEAALGKEGTGYGLRLIAEQTKNFQWSGNFGIAADNTVPDGTADDTVPDDTPSDDTPTYPEPTGHHDDHDDDKDVDYCDEDQVYPIRCDNGKDNGASPCPTTQTTVTPTYPTPKPTYATKPKDYDVVESNSAAKVAGSALLGVVGLVAVLVF